MSQEIRNETIYAWKNLQAEKIKIPTLVVAGSNDQIVNPKQSITFYKHLACKKELILIPDGDHGLVDKKYIPEYFPKVKEWLTQ